MKPLTQAAALSFFMLALVLLPTCAFAQTGWLDITSFGAVPNDGLDDTTAIQNAATAMCATSSPMGSVLYMPPGTYQVSSTITLNCSGIVQGAGMDRTTVAATSAGITVFSTGTSTGHITFREFQITATVTKTGGAGILLGPTSATGPQQGGRVENVGIGKQYQGIVVQNMAYWVIRDCMISESVATGISISVSSIPDAGDNLITGCVFSPNASGTGIAISVGSSGGQKIIGNKILGHTYGIYVQPTSTTTPLVDILIANNSIENQGSSGIFWQTPISGTGLADAHIVGNQIANQGSASIVMSGNVGGVVINDNQISMTPVNGLGIYLTGSATGTPSQISVVGNNITSNGAAGQVGIYGGNIGSMEIHSNYVSALTPFSNIAGRITDATFTAATLPAAAAGSLVYCSDCVVASTCSGSGSGAFAKRVGASWVCN